MISCVWFNCNYYRKFFSFKVSYAADFLKSTLIHLIVCKSNMHPYAVWTFFLICKYLFYGSIHWTVHAFVRTIIRVGTVKSKRRFYLFCIFPSTIYYIAEWSLNCCKQSMFCLFWGEFYFYIIVLSDKRS